MSAPAKRMLPARAGVSPMIERTVVVLPMPLRPISVTISPGRDGKRHAEQHLAQAVGGFDAGDFEHGLSHSSGPLLFFAEIGLAHLGIGADDVGRARGDHAAIDQHRDAVGEREHRLHVVLDQQDGVVAFQRLQHGHHARRILRGRAPPSARRAAACAACSRAPWRAPAAGARHGSRRRPASRHARPSPRARARPWPVRAIPAHAARCARSGTNGRRAPAPPAPRCRARCDRETAR